MSLSHTFNRVSGSLEYDPNAPWIDVMDRIRTEILYGINQNESYDSNKEEKHINLVKMSDFILFFLFNEKMQEKCVPFELIRLKKID